MHDNLVVSPSPAYRNSLLEKEAKQKEKYSRMSPMAPFVTFVAFLTVTVNI